MLINVQESSIIFTMCFCRAHSVVLTIIDTWEVYLLHVSLYVYEISPNLSLTIAS